MSRTKYVYTDCAAIAHLWMGHNLSGGEGQSSARNPRGNFYFNDSTIYSYGSHFPIASFRTTGEGKHKRQAIHFTTRTYSVTTAKHIREVKDAIAGNDIPVFYVANPCDSAEGGALSDYLSRMRYAIENQSSARATHNIARYQTEATDLETECRAFCKFWKIKAPKFPKVPPLPADFDARRVRERANEAKRNEAQRIEREARAAQWAKDNAAQLAKYTAEVEEWNTHLEEHIADWLAGGELNRPECYGYGYYGSTSGAPEPINVPTLLRIKGVEVETSRYASFPVEHAIRGLALVRAVMARGEAWEANGHTCKLGLYQIRKIDADGTVYAGCHVVPWESINRIAPALDSLALDNQAARDIAAMRADANPDDQNDPWRTS